MFQNMAKLEIAKMCWFFGKRVFIYFGIIPRYVLISIFSGSRMSTPLYIHQFFPFREHTIFGGVFLFNNKMAWGLLSIEALREIAQFHTLHYFHGCHTSISRVIRMALCKYYWPDTGHRNCPRECWMTSFSVHLQCSTTSTKQNNAESMDERMAGPKEWPLSLYFSYPA